MFGGHQDKAIYWPRKRIVGKRTIRSEITIWCIRSWLAHYGSYLLSLTSRFWYCNTCHITHPYSKIVWNLLESWHLVRSCVCTVGHSGDGLLKWTVKSHNVMSSTGLCDTQQKNRSSRRTHEAPNEPYQIVNVTISEKRHKENLQPGKSWPFTAAFVGLESLSIIVNLLKENDRENPRNC